MTEKRCTKCGEIKPVSRFFWRGDRGQFHSWCKSCCNEQNKKYYSLHKEYTRERAKISGRRSLQKLRLSIFRHYSGGEPKCACCGEDTFWFLTLDHIENNGASHRAECGGTRGVLKWIVRNGFPSGFQVLCWNCHMAKSNWGRCPHQDGFVAANKFKFSLKRPTRKGAIFHKDFTCFSNVT